MTCQQLSHASMPTTLLGKNGLNFIINNQDSNFQHFSQGIAKIIIWHTKSVVTCKCANSIIRLNGEKNQRPSITNIESPISSILSLDTSPWSSTSSHAHAEKEEILKGTTQKACLLKVWKTNYEDNAISFISNSETELRKFIFPARKSSCHYRTTAFTLEFPTPEAVQHTSAQVNINLT